MSKHRTRAEKARHRSQAKGEEYMTEKQQAAMRQAIEALEQWNAPSYKRHNAITVWDYRSLRDNDRS